MILVKYDTWRIISPIIYTPNKWILILNKVNSYKNSSPHGGLYDLIHTKIILWTLSEIYF